MTGSVPPTAAGSMATPAAGVAADLLGSTVPASGIASELFGPDFSAFQAAVETATGVTGLVLILVYSFLIAFVLPLPSEVVLFPGYAGMGFGLPQSVDFAMILLVSGVGKATGSVFAFHIGQEAKQAGPVIRALRNSRFDVVSWSENRAVELAREYGYAGLALALCVPGFPDTISIYAFAVLERDYYRFALATFVGSVGRLLVTMGGIGLGISVLGL